MNGCLFSGQGVNYDKLFKGLRSKVGVLGLAGGQYYSASFHRSACCVFSHSACAGRYPLSTMTVADNHLRLETADEIRGSLSTSFKFLLFQIRNHPPSNTRIYESLHHRVPIEESNPAPASNHSPLPADRDSSFDVTALSCYMTNHPKHESYSISYSIIARDSHVGHQPAASAAEAEAERQLSASILQRTQPARLCVDANVDAQDSYQSITAPNTRG